MLSPLISWIMSSSSTSSSSTSSDEEQSVDIDIDNGDHESDDDNDHGIENDHDHDTVYENEINDNDNGDNESDHFLSSGEGDDTIPVAVAVVPDATTAVTVAFPGGADDNSIPNRNTTTTMTTRPKRQRINYGRHYQRLWTKQDEMELLKGYLDYIMQHRWATTSLQNDVALLYDHIKPKLNVDFNRNQLVEKLRRLKRKHKIALDKINASSGEQVFFKSPQEQAIFEISQKIWGNNRCQDALDDDDESSPIPEIHDFDKAKVKTEEVDEMENNVELRSQKRQRLNADDVNRTTNEQNNGDATTSIQGLIEETMRSCFSPLLKEVFRNAQQVPPGELATISINFGSGEIGNEEWKKQSILELEVYLNRLELLQDQIKAKLEELRSSGE